MTTEVTKRWIEAGKILAADAKAHVLCPVCQVGVLEVSDVRSANDSTQLERHMRCPACRAHNFLRLTRST